MRFKVTARRTHPVCAPVMEQAGWDIRQPSRGLGDTVAKVTHYTGVARVVKAVGRITGWPCGCAKRQAKLNRAVPYEKG